jgi:osmoprotectant transport system ATP-binding protein
MANPPAMDQRPAISFENVTKRFGGGRPALDQVSLNVRVREFLAVVGESGSGKTTLLRLVNRLSDPTEGAVRVNGKDVNSFDPTQLRRQIGYVFQEIGLFPHMTVAENVGITPKLLGWEKGRIQARTTELLELVRLDRRLCSRLPGQLSGGERQRVAIARTLAARPAIVLMDEPFASLDAVTRDALSQDYRQLHDALHLTTVMITHDMLEALLLADRIVVLHAGRLVAEGAPTDLMTHEHADVRHLMEMPHRHAQRLAAFLATSKQ